MNGREQGGSSGGGADLKVKYEEIVKYTQRLTEQKDLVTKDIGGLKAQLASGSGSGSSGGKFQLWHIVMAVVLAFVAMKVFEKYNKEIMALVGQK